MSDIERKARQLLAGEYCDDPMMQHKILEGTCRNEELVRAERALIAALTPPEGYVLVPVEPTGEMIEAFNCKDSLPYPEPNRIAYKARHCYSAMLAARTEVK